MKRPRRLRSRRRRPLEVSQVLGEHHAAAVPGFFLYFPSRVQVSPALRAFIDVAREMAGRSNRRAS